LAAAGWSLKGGALARDSDGAPFRFEIMVSTKEDERLALAFARGLERIGARADVRLADSIQAFRRLQTYDFDMIVYNWVSSLSPGTEQKKYWSAAAADTPGERNYMGVKEPAVDAMIDAMLAARERPDFVSAVRALDRILLSGFYVVPLFHVREQWIARWKTIQRPDVTPLYGPVLETWWRATSPAGTDG
ncbi:ABC transporter substrate-binding protein, partial [Hansschlegelia beijingensis]